MNNKIIRNPVLPGFYPDPSICRVADDFYMVCSSFELYPGLPVFHSKDLANWELISHGMTKKNGFHVSANSMSGGVMAPTIRYNNGIFYIINANFSDKGNYIISAKDPAGEWSQPHWLSKVPTIDASLFFDWDGMVYLVIPGNIEKENGETERGFYLAEFDLETGEVIGKPEAIWNSALRGAASPEAPHIYHIGEYYYLMIAEGGTEHYHAITIARSKTLFGWYEGNPGNPVMTHRHFGFSYPLVNVGHGDLVDTPDGNWYAVMLGSRQIGGSHKNLGRETFLCPVIWEQDWPVFGPGSGKVEWEYPADKGLVWTEYETHPATDDFAEEKLDGSWCFWGTPYEDFYHISDSKLYLQCLKRPLCRPIKKIMLSQPEYREDDNVSFVGKRQTAFSFDAYCRMDFMPEESESAGMVLLQACNHQYRLERICKGGQQKLLLILVTTDMKGLPHMQGFESISKEKVLVETEYDKESIILGIRVKQQKIDFCFGTERNNLLCLYEGADGRAINPESIGGMSGTMVGMFASGNGRKSENHAAFDWFSYRESI